MSEHIVVVGAGLAGLRTVEELRAAGFGGEITMIGAESRPPYDRPPLSKQLMAGKIHDTSLREELDSLGARVRLGERAESLSADPGVAAPGAAVLGEMVPGVAGPGVTGAGVTGIVRTDRAEYRFDRLVVATGARPIALPGPGRQRFLRSIEDALELRELLKPGLRLAIVGAGWIGAELATAAAAKGCTVHVVEAGPAPLAAAIGAEVGAKTARWYSGAGVGLSLDQRVESVQDGGLSLVGGGWLAADEIVTAVGVRPETGWLESSGIALENGVAVDERLRSSMPGVYAVGDCAAFWSARFGRRLRTEHWDGALRAPLVLAANLTGGNERYDPVPYFWSEQFGRMLQYVGHHGGADQLIWRGDPDQDKWAVCWLAGPRLIAVLTVDLPKDLMQGRRLIEAGAAVDQVKLGDPAVPLRSAALL